MLGWSRFVRESMPGMTRYMLNLIKPARLGSSVPCEVVERHSGWALAKKLSEAAGSTLHVVKVFHSAQDRRMFQVDGLSCRSQCKRRGRECLSCQPYCVKLCEDIAWTPTKVMERSLSPSSNTLWPVCFTSRCTAADSLIPKSKAHGLSSPPSQAAPAPTA